MPFEMAFRDKPQNVFSVAREESAFYVRGTTGQPLETSAENVRIFHIHSHTESKMVLKVNVVSKMVPRENPHE